MRRKLFYASSLVLVMGLAACDNKDGSKEEKEAQTTTTKVKKEDLVARIQEYEAKLEDTSMDVRAEATKSLIGIYMDYAQRYPEEEISGNYLHKAFGNAFTLHQYHKAVKIADMALKMPHIHNEEVLLYQKAMVLDYSLRDTTEAKQTYITFLEKFPDSDYASQAECRRDNIQLSEDDIIRLTLEGTEICPDIEIDR